ncbi:MAG: DUF2125 domain-containing protein [Alphaproteobacteria bacterium]|nr:MAG: DUF2125 domain-containing protein [Alphaproteobacteria bacterium]
MPRRLTPFLAAFATLSALSATPGLADVTADEVWQEWQEIYGGNGISLKAAQKTRAANILTLGEVEAVVTFPEGTMRARAGEIRMEERGDGSVLVTFTPTSQLEIRANPKDAEPVEMDLQMTQKGNVMVVTDAGDGHDYSYTVPQATLALDAFIVDGVKLPVTLAAEFRDFAETAHVGARTGGLRDIEVNETIARTSFRFTAEDPEDKAAHVEAEGVVTGLRAATRGRFPAVVGKTFSEMQESGLEMALELEHDGAEYNVTGDGPEGAFAISSASAGGAFRYALDSERVTAHGESRGLRLELSGADIPFPTVAIGAEEISAELSFPAAPTPEPSAFSMALGLRGITVDDVLWSVFDPSGQLPRDPANLVIDLAGKARLLADVMNDPAALEGGQSPIEVDAVEIRQMELSAAGARLSGSGAFSFRYDSPDQPVPVGHVDLNLEGGNGLLDTLVSIGLLPEDQAMGMRMMLGAFARPGGGEDTLTSRIEMTEDGGIVANGMRMR